MRIELPEPEPTGGMTLSEAIAARRSRRKFSDTPIDLQALSQMLWAAQGVTGSGLHRRAVPSAGATNPMVVLVAVGSETVEGMAAGVYLYDPESHAVIRQFDGDVRADLAAAALGQRFAAAAPVSILMAFDPARIEPRYADRAERYADMEAGHMSQNIYLQAEALGLGTVAVGAFRDDEVAAVFRLASGLVPLYLMPVGHPA